MARPKRVGNCNGCRGTGYEGCPGCGGTGKRHAHKDAWRKKGEVKFTRCSLCRGTGKGAKCPLCDGTGKKVQ